MQIEILININSYQTWSLFFGRYFGSLRKVVNPKNDREEDHTEVWHRIYSIVMFFRLGFFLCACILWDAVQWKTNCLLKEAEICSLMFFQLLEHKQSQMKTVATVAPNRRLHMHACFYLLFVHVFAFVCKKNTRMW